MQAHQQQILDQIKRSVESVQNATSLPSADGNQKTDFRPSNKWVFTIFNPTPDRIALLQHFLKERCSFGHYQAERAPTTGTLHLQGFFALASGSYVQLKFIKEIFPLIDTHFEPMKGNLQQNLDYCTKERTRSDEIDPFTIGTIGKPGFVAKKITLKEALEQNPTLKDFTTNHPDLFCHYVNGIRQLYLERQLAESRIPPLVCWFWGPTGTGKTSAAVTMCEKRGFSYWISGDNLKWFCGYDGQEVVIFDDFRKMMVDFNILLRMLDRTKCMLQIKGGSVPFKPKVIIITNPEHPKEHYKYHDAQGNVKEREDIGQLLRRIHHILEFTPNYKPNIHFIVKYLQEDYKKKVDEAEQFLKNFTLDEPLHETINVITDSQQPIIMSDTDDMHYTGPSQPQILSLSTPLEKQRPVSEISSTMSQVQQQPCEDAVVQQQPHQQTPISPIKQTQRLQINKHHWEFSDDEPSGVPTKLSLPQYNSQGDYQHHQYDSSSEESENNYPKQNIHHLTDNSDEKTESQMEVAQGNSESDPSSTSTVPITSTNNDSESSSTSGHATFTIYE